MFTLWSHIMYSVILMVIKNKQSEVLIDFVFQKINTTMNKFLQI